MRGRGRARGGSLQTSSRGGSTQISSRDASQSTAQSDQSAQEQMGNILGNGGSGGSQNTTTDDVQGVGGNIQQAYRGLGDLPFQENFANGSFGAFQI